MSDSSGALSGVFKIFKSLFRAARHFLTEASVRCIDKSELYDVTYLSPVQHILWNPTLLSTTKDQWPLNSPNINLVDYLVWGAMLEAYHKLKTKPKTVAELKRQRFRPCGFLRVLLYVYEWPKTN